jgi:general stress protein 26
MAESDADRVWKWMKSICFCMMSHWSGEKPVARPMTAFVRRAEHSIYFFTDARVTTNVELQRSPNVCLAFSDIRRQKYIWVYGTATVNSDRGKIGELWNIAAKVWWKSPDNPNIRLITVNPEEAEFWDAPGNIISGLDVAVALIKGSHPHAGHHKTVQL